MQKHNDANNLKNARLTKEDLLKIGGFDHLSDEEIENYLETNFILANIIIDLYEKE
jgi:hypothetical protein